jgi:hypothetical protein
MDTQFMIAQCNNFFLFW